jgi:hypothetical protein
MDETRQERLEPKTAEKRSLGVALVRVGSCLEGSRADCSRAVGLDRQVGVLALRRENRIQERFTS